MLEGLRNMANVPIFIYIEDQNFGHTKFAINYH